jgi:competence protein ComEC
MLLLQPHWLQDVGFQLSVAATAGLVVSAEPLETRLRPALAAAPLPVAWRPRLAVVLAPALAVPFAASLWTLPLQLLHFGVVPLWAVPANALAAPLLTPLTLGAMAAAVIGLILPPVQSLLLPPLAWLAQALLLIAHGTAALPMAEWFSGRPVAWLVGLFSLGLLGLVVPHPPWRRRWAWLLALLACMVHLHHLRADALVLVQDGPRTLLLARHQGRGALISTSADALSCRYAARLAIGYGLSRYDWLLLLDPVPAADPTCWQRQAALVRGASDDEPPLASGQSLASPGLSAKALTPDSQAMELSLGGARWLLLPNRQALWSWRQRGDRMADSVWLGFSPGSAEHRLLHHQGPPRIWFSGAPGRSRAAGNGRWRFTGERGYLISRA